jgi:hypothetical protein
MACNPTSNTRDRLLRNPSDVYLSWVDADGYGIVQTAANRFADNRAKCAGRVVTGTVLVVGAGWTLQ